MKFYMTETDLVPFLFTDDLEGLKEVLKQESDLEIRSAKPISEYRFDFGGSVMVDGSDPELEFTIDGIEYTILHRHMSILCDILSKKPQKYENHYCFTNWFHKVFISREHGDKIYDYIHDFMMSNLHSILEASNEMKNRLDQAGVVRPKWKDDQ